MRTARLSGRAVSFLGLPLAASHVARDKKGAKPQAAIPTEPRNSTHHACRPTASLLYSAVCDLRRKVRLRQMVSERRRNVGVGGFLFHGPRTHKGRAPRCAPYVPMVDYNLINSLGDMDLEID